MTRGTGVFCERWGCSNRLSGRQARFCSSTCRRAQWARDTDYRGASSEKGRGTPGNARSRRGVNARSGAQISFKKAVEVAVATWRCPYTSEDAARLGAECRMRAALPERQRDRVKISL